MLIDSHCHLNLEGFDALADVRSRMLEQGVDGCIVVGIDLTTSDRALELARGNDWIRGSAGIHPCTTDFDDADESQWTALESLALDDACSAVGETGLDLFHDRVPLGTQTTRFIRQLDMARRLDKPVIVHCRDADDPCRDLLTAHGQGTRGVLHCWAGGLDLANAALDMGWYVSLAGNVTFKNAGALRDAAAKIPLERTLVETDSPFLAPHPHRGKANHPAWTSLVAEELARLHSVPFAEVVSTTRRNTLDLFGCSSPS